MRERWWCMDCRMMIELDRHGRCSTCSSNAVDSVERRRLWAYLEAVTADVATLEAEYARMI